MCTMAARPRTACASTCKFCSCALDDACRSSNPTAPALLGGLFRCVHRLPESARWLFMPFRRVRLTPSLAARRLVLQRGGLHPEKSYRKARAANLHLEWSLHRSSGILHLRGFELRCQEILEQSTGEAAGKESPQLGQLRNS